MKLTSNSGRAFIKQHIATVLLMALALLAFCFGSPARAQVVAEAPADHQEDTAKAEPEDLETEPQYVRVSEDEEDSPLALQTAIVSYVGRPGTKFAGKQVDLVGVVHVGQAEYYSDLDARLSTYDKVLYELVAPDGTRIKPEDLEERRSILASMQTGMKDMLNLEYQLEKIDYMADNFRHADMSPDEFSQDMEQRGDSVWKMLARMMGAGLATQAQAGGEAGLLMALFSKDRPMYLKRMMAKQLIDVELITAGINDEQGENTLIKGRNRKAFRILREELDAGAKRVAVFYGAGHLPDMAERLAENFAMEQSGSVWLDAWDLTRN